MILEALIFVATVLILYAFSTIRRPHGFPPGPTGLPIVGYLPFVKENPHVKLQELARKYGDMIGMRFGQRWVVVLNNQETIKEAFKDDRLAGRPEFPLILTTRSEGRKNGIIFSEGSKWHDQRRFTMRNLRDFGFGKRSMEEHINGEIEQVMDQLRKETGKPIDLRFKFNLAVINSLWYIMTGDKFNHDDPEMKKFFDGVFSVFERENITLQTDLFYPYMIKLLPNLYHVKEIKEVNDGLLNICRKALREHKKRDVSDDPADFMDVYLKRIREEKGPDSSFFQSEGENSLMIVMADLVDAGSDTSSSTLYWLFLFMILHPDKQRKVQKEIDQVIGRSRLPSLLDRSNMPYTEAVINETLRHQVLLPLGLFHEVIEDMELKGHRLPKGTVVIPNMYASQRDPRVWDSPEEFRPERFLPPPEGQGKGQDTHGAFGTGKRVCLGETLARAELFLFFTGLLQNFTFAYPAEDGPPTTKPSIGFTRQARPYKVVLQER